jgi:hypothetical protein
MVRYAGGRQPARRCKHIAKPQLQAQWNCVFPGGGSRQHGIDFAGGDLLQHRLERRPHPPPQQRRHAIRHAIGSPHGGGVPCKLDLAHQPRMVHSAKPALRQQLVQPQRQHDASPRAKLRQPPEHEIPNPQWKTVAAQDRSVQVANQHRRGGFRHHCNVHLPGALRLNAAHRTTRETGRVHRDTMRSPEQPPGPASSQ